MCSSDLLLVDDELFDWGLDYQSFLSAKGTIALHKELSESIALSIINHFLECFSEFIGREINLQEFNLAMEKGEI